MEVRKGDYILVRPIKKWMGYKVVGVSNGKVQIRCFDTPHLSPTVGECKPDDILVNLGKQPESGRVYGVDFTQRYRGHTEVPKLGLRLNWFYVPEKDQKRSIYIGMHVVYDALKKMKLNFLMENDNSVWEIQGHRAGKYSGRYLHPKDKLIPGRLQICPNLSTPPEYPYIIAHELGHRLHLRYAQEMNARWLTAFATSIKLIDIDKKESSRMLESLVGGDTLPSKFLRELDDDTQKLQYKWILRFIKSGSNMGVNDLDDLFRAQSFGTIRALWPHRSIPRKELAPLLTEYSTKNMHELVAESFAFYLGGKKLPANLTKLIEKTITIARHNYKHPD